MNRVWKLILQPALLLAVVFVAGCATSGIEATGKPMGDPKFAKHLVIHNETLAGDIIISDMQSRVTGDLLEVNVILTNLTSSDKHIQYRFSWFDSDNFEVEQGSRSWTPVTLNGNADTSMKAVAPNPSVNVYKVNVREM
ncbi:MAG: YcfL family protein [Ectothiorhodospiraceae bacterium]|nr:YcfL family protein [Ectothiorhodospiraceae bacterium]